jgi:ubiquinone/menaquinone biosynthesis C-methylase UbiE
MSKGEKNPVISELEKLKNGFNDVIDIGCGNGKMLLQIAEKFDVNGIGIDKSSSRISSARSEAIKNGLADNIRFSVQSAEELDFENESFDVAVSSFCIHELDDQVCGLREICRVLKKEGIFICLDWTKEANVSQGQRPLSVEEMEDFCSEAGFKEVHAEYLESKRIFCIAKCRRNTQA